VTTTAHDLDLLTAARTWHDAGYAVVPSRDDNSKRPFGKWKEYQQTRPTWDEVAGWLTTGRYTGIGVITGQVSGNVEMIELEGPRKAAAAALAKITKTADYYSEIGAGDLWRQVVHQGCVEQSGGGGLHIFVRVVGEPVEGNTKLAADEHGKVLAETRGEGGFVIVAPTPGRTGHEPGAGYTFISDASPDRTPTVSADDLAVLRHIITEALHSHTEATTPAPQAPTSTPATNAPQAPTGALTPWDDYATQTTWADILEPLGWQPVYTAPDGRTHWTRPGKTTAQGTSATTLEDGPLYVFSTSTTFPAGIGMSKQHVYAHLHHGGDHKAAAIALADQGFGTAIAPPSLPPWVPPGVNPDTMSAQELQDAQDEWVSDHLPVLDWHALWADETTEEWIVEPILAKRRLVALYSAPKVGKSLLMLELAASIAAGRKVLDSPASPPVRTLYVDFENDPFGDIRERLRAMGFAPDDLANLCYLSFPNLGKLDTQRGGEELLAAVKHYRCEVVVVDTVSRSVQGDENENDTWLSFYRHTGVALKREKVALIRLDHSGKDESKGQRGGSAKSGDVDAVWRMSVAGDDTFTLTCEAQRFPIAANVITIKRTEEPHLHHEVVGNPARERHEELLEALTRLNVNPDVSPTNATALLRAAGVKVGKGRIPDTTWQTYKAMPHAFTIEHLPNNQSGAA
jgi:hypothetical protein